MEPIDQYLARYAEPEARLDLAGFERLGRGRYGQALVVPVRAEDPGFCAGYEQALRSAQTRTLLIVVVNARETDEGPVLEQNARTLRALELGANAVSGLAPGLNLLEYPLYDVLLVDRSGPGCTLPDRQGVGLARRIGSDLALRAIRQGTVEGPWIYFSDADAELPADHFRARSRLPHAVRGLTFPFVHELDEGTPVGLATATAGYELSLRYYVLGLEWARSPYAFHALGSAMAVHASGYAEVRGVPRRLAGEDFYLLGKLAKVGPIARPRTAPVRIRARRSDRVPFGTGPAVLRLEQDELALYPPYVFRALAAWLERLDAFAEAPDALLLEAPLDLPPAVRRAAEGALEAAGAVVACGQAARSTSAGAPLRRRLHTWFDSLRTLRFIHRVRGSAAQHLPWWEALEHAAFVSAAFAPADVRPALALLRELESGRAAAAGSGRAASGVDPVRPTLLGPAAF